MGVSDIYCLGDVVGYYPQINECCEELRSRNIPCMMGNHDWYMASGGFCPRSQSVNDCLVYQRKTITPENVEWLRALPIQRIVGDIHMVHGGWTDPIDEYLNPSEEYFEKLEGGVFLAGHTHIQLTQLFPGAVYCNPGSVGQPRDNDPRAAFATYDGKIALHRIKYDMEVIFDLMQQLGFDDYYYGSLKTGARNLCKL
jgi:diadenosine tetraphosphatase ApaH/serine/threonine PP2A family protein phosphatase